MRVQQFTLAPTEDVTAFLGELGGRQLTLDANELRTRRFAAFFQPVGVNQAPVVVVAPSAIDRRKAAS